MCYFCVFLFIPHVWVETSKSAFLLEDDRSGLNRVAVELVDPEAKVTKRYYEWYTLLGLPCDRAF